MHNIESHLTDSRPKWRPVFLRDIETLGNEVGFVNAVHQTLQQDNIRVDIDGDLDRLQEHQNGVLFVGDHKNQWEFVALMDMLSRMERTDMLNVAKFYVKRQVHQALGSAASKLIIPVYPRLLASDRNEFFNSETLNRVAYRNHLLTTAESAEANTRAVEAVAERLSEGGVGNIFPTGSVVNSLSHPWREGVGRIVNEIPDEMKKDVLIVPYKLDDVSRKRPVGAVAMRGRGIFGKLQTMGLRLGPIHTAGELIDSLADSDRESQSAITQRLRSQFIDYFGIAAH